MVVDEVLEVEIAEEEDTKDVDVNNEPHKVVEVHKVEEDVDTEDVGVNNELQDVDVDEDENDEIDDNTEDDDDDDEVDGTQGLETLEIVRLCKGGASGTDI